MSKTPQDILDRLQRQVEERDNNQSRHQRLKHLGYLRNRITAWMGALEVPARSEGPSLEEMDCILTDLEKQLKDLRRLQEAEAHMLRNEY